MKVLNKLPPKHLGFRKPIIKDIRKQNKPIISRNNLSQSISSRKQITLPMTDKKYKYTLGNVKLYYTLY